MSDNQLAAPPFFSIIHKDDVLHFTLWYDKFFHQFFHFAHSWHWCCSRKERLLTTAACNLSHLIHQNSPGRFSLVLSSSLHYPFHHSHFIHPSPICVSAVQPFWQQGIRGPQLWGATSQETTLSAVNPNMKEWIKWLELCYRGGQQTAPLMVLYTQISHQYSCDRVLRHWGWGDNQGCQQHLFHSVKEQWRQAEAQHIWQPEDRSESFSEDNNSFHPHRVQSSFSHPQKLHKGRNGEEGELFKMGGC